MKRIASDLQRATQARYDAARPAPVLVRLTPDQLVWLDAQRQGREGRSTVLKRLAGVPATT